MIDGISIKKYGTTNLDDFRFHNNGGYFMDRVGGLDCFFTRAETIPEASGLIRCFSDSEIDTNFQAVACNYRLITLIEEFKNKNGMKIFPNPVNKFLYIQHLSLNKYGEFSFKIMDFTGKQIRSFITINSLETIDVSDFKPGIYFLNIQNSNNQIIRTFKFIKK